MSEETKGAAGGATDPAGDTPPMLCELAIAAAERARDMPRYLMQAIAYTESGYISEAHGRRVAWPWTVMAEGKGRYYPSKDAAIAAVEGLRARGVGNIDVGCMQVNLHYHGDAFASLEEAFDPVHNVAYATAFLLDLRRKANSWTRAIKQYHSRDRERQFTYRARVYEEWEALRHGRVAVPASPTMPGADGKKSQPGGISPSSVNWPPRSYSEQKRLETIMRARVMSVQR
ncbi:transglycosylase SLT domain-containing protein [Marivibrio halodurans]|uniref:Transglycosylase SLT domain-containing protein n=2 Tax=Marivibrio halodurans TaxID=2039722 RepID=A0A8J7V2E9_9PROT|nr:transglycosylase SLT domain-containing protein [Marivibrio halodurans]